MYSHTSLQQHIKRFFSHAWMPCTALLLIILLAICAPWLGSIEFQPGSKFQSPSMQAFFGTDRLGRDIWLLVLHGARTSLLIGCSVMVLSSVVGSLIGLLCTWNTLVDAWILRVTDAFIAIPSILLAIACLQVFEAGIETVILALAIAETPKVIRLVRSSILSARDQPYVSAAMMLGTPTHRVLFKHLLPSAYAPLLVHMAYIFSAAMLMEAILGFLGLGISPEIASWGNLIAEGQVYLHLYPWLVIFPSIFLSITVLCVYFIGDALRDTLDIHTAPSEAGIYD